MALLRAVATVGSYTMLSRILGFARDILIAATLGAGMVADAFFVAFKMPNFFRRLFAEGAFNAAYIPLFARQLAEGGRAGARRFAEEVLSVMVVALFLFVTAAQIAMPWVMLAFSPGFATDPVKFDLTVQLTRITFPYLLFISLVSQLGGVLNTLGRFAAAAATPIILNVFLISALLGLTAFVPTTGHALAWGVAGAGVAQFLFLIVACARAGMRFHLPRPRLTPRVRRLIALIIPGAIGAGVVQINLVIGMIIATLLPAGSVSYLYYSDRIYQLPLGVVGVAVGTALLPLLSRQLREGQAEAARDSMNRALEISLVLTVPAAAALMVIPEPLIAALFERGSFGPDTTRATANALIAFSAGLPAYVLIKVLAPGFFAREDTTTPVVVAGFCVAINVGLSLALMGPLLHVGIAVATSVAAWVNMLALAVVLYRRGQLATDARLRRRLAGVAVATAGMTAALYGALDFLSVMLASGPMGRGVAVACLVALGLVAYGLLATITGAARPAELRAMMRRQGG